MELLVREMGEVHSCKCFAQHMWCVQMDGDGNVWDKLKVFACLPCCMLIYLRKFVAFLAFFPSNETLHFLCFFFPLAHSEPLLLAPWASADSLEVDFLGVDFLGADFLEAAGVPLFFRILWGFFFVSCCPWLFCLGIAWNSLQLILKGLNSMFHRWGGLCCCFLH